MAPRITPLGFLPVNVECHSHGMLIYSEKDESLVQAVAEYLAAGIRAGEMCVCYISEDLCGRVKEKMAKVGSEPEQLHIIPGTEFRDSDGSVDLASIRRFFVDSFEIANREYSGLRLYIERALYASDRPSRLKLLETESCINLSIPGNVIMCGYETSSFPHSHIVQAKSVHHFIANVRSMRRNNSFKHTARFLAGFYEFKQTSKSYPGTRDGLDKALEQFVEVASRTPLDLVEMKDFRAAIGDAFAELTYLANKDIGIDTSHVHAVFAAEPEEVTIILKAHRTGDAERCLDAIGEQESEVDQSGIHKRVDCEPDGDITVTLTKRYKYLLWQWLNLMQPGKTPDS